MSQPPALLPPLTDDRRALGDMRDVCEESVYRLNAVLRLLEDHDCCESSDAADAANSFDLVLIREELQRIRERLREAS